MVYVKLDKNSSDTLTKQIYMYLRNSILNGILKADEKLPSTRELAKYLEVSRNIVIETYEQLEAEGYLYTKSGSGTFVCEGITFKIESVIKNNSKRADNNLGSNDTSIINFKTGIPDLKSIPIKKWARIYKNICDSADNEYMNYQDSKGQYIFRKTLSQYLNYTRGVNTTADNIIITNGAAQAFSLLTSIVSDKEYVLLENPMSFGLYNTLKNKNINLKYIPVDEMGLMTEYLPKNPPKLIFTTPSHQFPTGVIMSIKRRIDLIKYAQNNNCYIVEDDYDSEFKFEGTPISSMQSLDSDHVIYVGTFSKTFMPSLRMGYMVLPDSLIDKLNDLKYIDDIHSPVLDELTMTEFISSRFYENHIRKMTNLYLRRRNFLIKALNENFKDDVSIFGTKAGLHLAARFKNICFNDNIIENMKKNKVIITPMQKLYIESDNNIKDYNDVLIFGYGNTNEELIDNGIKRLKKSLI